MILQDTYEVKKADIIPVEVSVPGSKSITNRALLIAALANGKSVLKGVLFSDDSRHFLQALQDLGFVVEIDEPHAVVSIEGKGGRVPKTKASVDVGSAGTAARFLTAYLGLTVFFDGTEHVFKVGATDCIISFSFFSNSTSCGSQKCTYFFIVIIFKPF